MSRKVLKCFYSEGDYVGSMGGKVEKGAFR